MPLDNAFRDATFEADVHASRQLLHSASCTVNGTPILPPPSSASASTFRFRPSTAPTTHVFTNFSTPLFQRVFDNAALQQSARDERRQKKAQQQALAHKYLGTPLPLSLPASPPPPPASRLKPASPLTHRPRTAAGPPRALRPQAAELRALRADLRRTTAQIEQTLQSDPSIIPSPSLSPAQMRWLTKHGYAPPAVLSEAELQRYNDIFATLDTDGSGSLTVAELRRAMAALRLPLSDDETRRLMSTMDRNGDHLVTLHEFTQAMTSRQIDSEWDAVERIHAERKGQRRPLTAPRTPSSARPSGEIKSPDAVLSFALWVPAWVRKNRFDYVMEGEQRARLQQQQQQTDERRERAYLLQQQRMQRLRGATPSPAPSTLMHKPRLPTAFSDHSYVSKPVVEPRPPLTLSPTFTPPRSPLLHRRLMRGATEFDVRWERDDDEEGRDDAGSLAWQWKKRMDNPPPPLEDDGSLEHWKAQRAAAARLPADDDEAPGERAADRAERESRLLARVGQQVKADVREEAEEAEDESRPVAPRVFVFAKAKRRSVVDERRASELVGEVKQRELDADIERLMEESDRVIARSRATREGTVVRS